MAGNADINGLIGPRKSAVMMHAIGADRARRLMARMSAEEIDLLSQAMDSLGVVAADAVEKVLADFAGMIEVRQAPERQPATPKTHDVELPRGAPQRRSSTTDFSA